MGHPLTGRKQSQDHIEKRAAKLRGLKRTDDQRRRISEAHKGIKLSDEAKKKLSIASKGRKKSVEFLYYQTLSRKGISSSPETREKIRKANLGKRYPPEVNAKKASFLGRTHTKETKEKLRMVNIGKRHSEETKEKIRAARSLQVFPLVSSKPENTFADWIACSGVGFSRHRLVEGMQQLGVYHQFDFRIDSLRLLIEIDGCYWHGCTDCFEHLTEKQVNQRNRDMVIDQLANRLKWTVIRIKEHQIMGRCLGNKAHPKELGS